MSPAGMFLPWVWMLAAQAPWGLGWRAPAECIQPAELAQRVEERLGQPVFGADPSLRINGVLRRSDDAPTWRAKLTLIDEQGTVLGSREVSSDEQDCRALEASLVLVVAVMIDPLAAFRAPPQAEAPPPPPPPAPPPPDPPPSPEPAVPDSSSVEPPNRAFFGLTGGWGPAPSPMTYGLVVGLQLGGSEGPFMDWRLPFYPYLPVSTGQARGDLYGMGLGVGLGWRLAPLSEAGWRPVLSVGADGLLFLGRSEEAGTPRWQLLGRADAVARIGVQGKLGPVHVSVEISGGWTPWPPTFRLATIDGRPEDVSSGPLRAGIELVLFKPIG
jgi:hypothetical protein